MTKVLVADDERVFRDLLTGILVDGGHDVIEARNGREVLELALHELPDLVLLDVCMPGMDGFDVLVHLRQSPSTASIPVILLTVTPAVKGEQAAMRLGVEHYITKPWDRRTVESAITLTAPEAAPKEATFSRASPGCQISRRISYHATRAM